MRNAAGLVMLLGVASSGFAQSFEVASVKPTTPAGNGTAFVGQTGGPGTDDPTRVRFTNLPLGGLIMNAYGISYFQLSGPDWMNTARFDVIATLPAATTKEQFRVMLQNLLAERFKLAVHRERKKMGLYSLTVAPGGPKFRETVTSDDTGKPGVAESVARDKDGYPVLRAGMRGAMLSGPRGVMYARIRASGDDAMTYLVSQISGQLAAPVEDDTGLTGRYDFTLSWVAQTPNNPGDDLSGPDILTAVRDELGLKLTPKKGEVDIVVVDHAEKQPAEN